MVKVIALLKRKKGMSQKDFEKRWLEQHVKLSRELPGLKGYRINIALQTQPTDLQNENEPIYDGTAELWWESIEEMEESFNSDIGIKAGKDADDFADVRIHIYTTEHVIL